MNDIRKNLFYQTILQILNTCLPLITSPYLSRILAAEGLGRFSYTQSIVNYFTLFSMLGVINYGTRSIAIYKRNKEERSIEFWNIYFLQYSVSLIALISYVIYILFFLKDNVIIAWFQIFYIIAAMFDISWVFFGMENFKITAKINTIIRIISVIVILTLVKSLDDLWIYTFIMSGSLFFGNILLWLFLFKIIDIKKIKNICFKGILKHIKPNLILFIPLLAMSVYHIMDKTMLGLLSSYEQTGFYYNADKIINIPAGIITGIGTVMLPKMSTIINLGDKEKANKIFKVSIEMIIMLAIAITFGISAISFKFIPFFFGKGFDECISLVIVLSPVIIIKGLSYTIRMQYLIPNFKEKIFIQSIFIGAIVNLVINIILIPNLDAMGAVLGTLIAEFISCFWQYKFIYKDIKDRKLILNMYIYILFGMIMSSIIYFIGTMINDNLVAIIVQFILGVIIYIGLCICYWILTKNFIFKIIFNKNKGEKQNEFI